MSNMVLEPNDLRVSFDVPSLFPKIFIRGRTTIIPEMKHADKHSSGLLGLITSTYFSVQMYTFYQQTPGTLMDSMFSPIVAIYS